MKEFYGLLEELLGDYNISFNVEALQNACFRFSRVAETSNAASEGTEKAGCRQNRKIVSHSLYTMYRLWFVMRQLYFGVKNNNNNLGTY